MDSLLKLNLLSQQMPLEPDSAPAPNAAAPCGHSPAEVRRVFESTPRANEVMIGTAQLPNGQRMRLLKTLLTSACERDCYYCPFRARRNFRRATFKPQEMADLFANLHRAGLAEGLFLSSGIAGGSVRTQDKLLDTADILRHKRDYRGYLHLKLMPGAQRDQITRAMQLADRVSVNLEAPNTARLQRLAPHKVFVEELLDTLTWAHTVRQTTSPHTAFNQRWPSLVTQLVVGAAGEDDVEILATTAHVTQRLRLQRVYFSAFHPIRDTPLENQPPEDPWREHRLYQASFLLRDYGFTLEDMPFDAARRLPLHLDPKMAWAQQHLAHAPVDVQRADRPTLLRVPGIGPKGVEAIVRARRLGTLRDLRDLKKLGVLADRAAPFILLNGRRANPQLSLGL